MKGLIRSGWWIVVAAALVSVVMVIFLISEHGLLDARRKAAVPPTPWNGFDISSLVVPASHITTSGMARDGVPVLDHPEAIPPAEVDRRTKEARGKLLVSHDRVVGVSINGNHRAYPIRLLSWHEVVNDTVGGEPLAVTYSPLCDSVVVLSRRLGDEVLEFGASGLLMASNHLLYDRRSDLKSSSLWSQLQARAISGPGAAAGLSLRVIEADLTTWAEWRQLHPETDVMAPLLEYHRIYKRKPYNSYFGNDLLRFPSPITPPPSDLRLKDLVVAITIGEQRSVVALKHLAQAGGANEGVWDIVVGTTPVRIHFSFELGTSTVTSLMSPAPPIDIRRACWFAWYAAAPGPLDQL